MQRIFIQAEDASRRTNPVGQFVKSNCRASKEARLLEGSKGHELVGQIRARTSHDSVSSLTGDNLEQSELIERALECLLDGGAKLSDIGSHIAAEHAINIASEGRGRRCLAAVLCDELHDLLGKLCGSEFTTAE